MRILQLCKKFPFPMRDGESLAIVHLAKALAGKGASVTLLAMNTSKHRAFEHHFNEAKAVYAAIHAVEIDNRVKVLPALQHLFSDNSYHIARFISPVFEKKLEKLLSEQHFDVVQLETPYLAPYLPIIRQHSNAKVVMRAHNVEHEIWERIAQNAAPLKKMYLKKITPQLRDFEIRHLNQYDLLAAISERDLAQFRQLGLQQPAVVLPIGLDGQAYQPDAAAFTQPLSLCFIGSLDWQPNVEGLKWFLEKVWQPLVLPKFPNLRLHIAGRNTPTWLQNARIKNVTVHGEVPDAAQFINQHAMMVVPLLSGSGMRAKILENMALGKVSLTTQIGLEGIPAVHQQEVLIANHPTEFLAAITDAVENRKKIEQIGKNARFFFDKHYDNDLIVNRLLYFYESWINFEAVVTD